MTVEAPTTALYEAPTERLDHAIVALAAAPHWPADAAPAGRHLLLQEGDQTEMVRLRSAVTHLGRGLTADVRLDDHRVSRRHAIIVADARGARLIDDRSANGVVLNGRVVDEADLHDGDVIVLGRSVLRYLDA